MLLIGQQYLTTWGNTATIQGFVVRERGTAGRPDVLDETHVWSAEGEHYERATGKGGGFGGPIVDLPPADELVFWRERLAQFRAANSPDHLALIADGIARIEARIRVLEALGA